MAGRARRVARKSLLAARVRSSVAVKNFHERMRIQRLPVRAIPPPQAGVRPTLQRMSRRRVSRIA